MIEFNIFYKLAAALGIGFIIGMQRENSYSLNNSRHPAGLCSFSIVSLCGALSCYLGDLMGSIVPFVVGLVIVGLLLVASHIAYGLTNRGNGGHAGVTTSAALIMIYFLGALCWFNRLLEACILMIVLLWLLAVKRQLHDFAKKISTEDIIATVKFAVISLMILPFLPNKAFGPTGLEV
ncbi:MAG: MgtC/SapB family protein, partial [Fibrobacter sp.]|nr:MgtC/SapB family protein [Fibrobacter sp.]